MTDEKRVSQDSAPSGSEPRLSRRGLLGMLLGGVLAAGVAVHQWQRRRRAPDARVERPPEAPGPAPEHALAQEIRRRLPSLRIDDGVIAAFVRDYERHVGQYRPGRRRDGRWPPHLRFLMSTDFFSNAATAATRPLRYLAFYDPYRSPCHNPLVDWS